MFNKTLHNLYYMSSVHIIFFLRVVNTVRDNFPDGLVINHNQNNNIYYITYSLKLDILR